MRVMLCCAMLTVLGACTRESTAPASCPVVLTSEPKPAVLRMTIQAITAGTPPSPVDPAHVRGVVTVTINVDQPLIPDGARLDLRAGGKVMASAVLPASSPVPTSAPLTIDTRSLPNGQQAWSVTLIAGATTDAACTSAQIGTLTQTLTVTN